jgi:hypothetical protein
MTLTRGEQLIASLGVGMLAAAIVLWPSHAYAWGPLAHIDFARSALEDLAGVPEAVSLLLTKCTSEYLYGALAADIIVGKNLAPYGSHAHNWKTGFRVLERAETDAQRAFAYGYLAHLAVDTIAHNYYVPYKIAVSYGRPRTGHGYWEMRYDQKLPKDLWQVARKVTQRAQRRHDHFLKDALVGAYVLPFSVSRRFFETLLLSARLKKWQSMSRLVAAERKLPIDADEVEEMKILAVGQIHDLLAHGEHARCTKADPAGLRNIRLAHDLRKRLKAAGSEGHVPEAQTLVEVRDAFRHAIHGPLKLPAMHAIYA